MQLKEHQEKKETTVVKTKEEMEEHIDVDDEESREEGNATEQENTNDEATTVTTSTTVAEQLQREGEPHLVQDEPTAEDILPQTDHRFRRELDILWLTDPMLNVAIVLLAVICFLLSRKCFDLYDDLQSLS